MPTMTYMQCPGITSITVRVVCGGGVTCRVDSPSHLTPPSGACTASVFFETNDLSVFDPSTATWSALRGSAQDTVTPLPRTGNGMAAVGGLVYVFSGDYDNSDSLRKISHRCVALHKRLVELRLGPETVCMLCDARAWPGCQIGWGKGVTLGPCWVVAHLLVAGSGWEPGRPARARAC